MAKQKNGGPAFPTDNRMAGEQGMSVRDYLAAHAPNEPLWGFKPQMPSDRPKAVYGESEESLKESQEAMNAWEDEYSKQVAIQWRWAYADAMLAEREKQP